MLTTSTLPDKCRLVVEETFPRGMYVDLDQLRDLAEMQGLRTYTSAKINVESPAFEAESFRLYIFVNLEIQENLRLVKVELPVHLRYQKPRFQTSSEKKRGDQPVAMVRLQNPRLLLSCEGENVSQHCPERTVVSHCDSTGEGQCEYLQIPYKAVSSKVLQLYEISKVFACFKLTFLVDGAFYPIMLHVLGKT